MSIVPKDFIKIKYQQIVRLRGEDRMIPFVLLKDEKQRIMALPLDCPQGKLIQGALEGNGSLSKSYHTLLNCFEQLSVELKAVCMHHNKDLDLPTHLVLQQKTGEKVEVDVPCVDGIAYAQIAGVPIYIAEELMLEISATTAIPERRSIETQFSKTE